MYTRFLNRYISYSDLTLLSMFESITGFECNKINQQIFPSSIYAIIIIDKDTLEIKLNGSVPTLHRKKTFIGGRNAICNSTTNQAFFQNLYFQVRLEA